MIYIYILLCVCFAPFIQTETQYQLTDDETQQAFQTSRDNAPEHKVISDDNLRHNRSINELTILTRFGKYAEYFDEIILQSVEGYFAGKDTKVWLAEKDSLNETKFKYTLQPDIMEKVNITFYHDPITQSAITHRINKRGLSEYNGVIDSDKIISPLKDVLRKHRDVSSELFNESDNLKNLHIIYKRETNSSDKLEKEVPKLNKTEEEEQIMKESSLGAPTILYPEILVFVDKTIFEYFNKDIEKTVAYILTLWNQADLLYRQLEKPKVRLNIAGIVICQDQIIPMNPFVVNETTLERFRKFLFNEDKFKLREDYDIAAFMGMNPRVKDGYLGLAKIRSACSNDSEEILSTIAVLDNTKFSGAEIAVHELAHLFGAHHDGIQTNTSYPGAPTIDCSFSGYHLMNEQGIESMPARFFSSCSQEMMSFFFSRENAECLRNNPADSKTEVQILRVLPGTHMSIDEQCQRHGYLKADPENLDICKRIYCLPKEIAVETVDNGTLLIDPEFREVRALDGTPCGYRKFCFLEECAKVMFNKKAKDFDQEKLFTPQYRWLLPGFNTTAKEQCWKYKYSYETIGHSAIFHCKLRCTFLDMFNDERLFRYSAMDGTSCGTNGYCRDEVCILGN